jgi:L-threonylcarbamoyladenylate synthase
MKTRVMPVSPESLHLARDILHDGGLVAFPTDTVYGVGASAFDGPAVEGIYIAKDRPLEKSIPVLIADYTDLTKVTRNIPEMAENLARHFWPGPLTLVVPKGLQLPQAVTSTQTVGVRLPDLSVARELLRLAGPMAVTSANLSGGPDPNTARAVGAQLGGRIALILDGGGTPGGVPSTVVDCTGSTPRILREGPIKEAQIRAFLIG